METWEFLSEVWAKFVQGEIGIDAVVEEYHKHGFDVNQDIPGNVYWEELYLEWKISQNFTNIIIHARFALRMDLDDRFFILEQREQAQRSRKLKSFWLFGIRLQHGGRVIPNSLNRKPIDNPFLGTISPSSLCFWLIMDTWGQNLCGYKLWVVRSQRKAFRINMRLIRYFYHIC